jgi:hypothetical protein
MVNWKDAEGYGHGLIVVLSLHLRGGTEENHEKPVRIVAILAEFRTKHLLNRSLDFITKPSCAMYT